MVQVFTNLSFSQQTYSIYKPKFVKVPNLIGKEKADAIKTLKKVGLGYQIILSIKFDKRYKGMENRVISQNPKAGKYISQGLKVSLTIYNPVKKSFQPFIPFIDVKKESRLSSFTIDPEKVNPGDYVIAKLLLSNPAGKNGAKVYITSYFSNIKVPKYVLIPKGEKSTTFKIDVPASLSDILPENQNVKIKVWYDGVSKEASFIVIPVKKCKLSSLIISPNTVKPGGFVLATVKMSAPVEEGTEKISIYSSNNNIKIPKEILIPKGVKTSSFKIEIPYSLSKIIKNKQTVEIKVSNKKTVKKSAFTIELSKEQIKLSSFTLNPQKVEPGEFVTGKIELSSPADKKGAEVLVNSYFSNIKVPKKILIPEGEKSTTFKIDVPASLSKILSKNQNVKIKAWYGVNKEASFEIVMLTEVKSVELNSNRIIGGGKIKAEITLNRPAIGEGNKVEILITANYDNLIRGPNSIVIPKGKEKGVVYFSTSKPQDISKLYILNFRCSKITKSETVIIQREYIGLIGLFEKPELEGGEGFVRVSQSESKIITLYAKQNYPSPPGGIVYRIEKGGDFQDKITIPEEILINGGQTIGSFKVEIEPVGKEGKSYIYAISPDGKKHRCILDFK